MNATYWGRLIGGRMLEIGDTFGELTVENIEEYAANIRSLCENFSG